MSFDQTQLDLGCGEIGPAPVIMVDALFHFVAESQAAYAVGARNGHMWAHLWCEPGHEHALHRMAAEIGLRVEWFQPKPGFPHYDLTPRKRAAAINAGARETDLVEWIRARREAGR